MPSAPSSASGNSASREPADPRFTPVAEYITGPWWREVNGYSEEQANSNPCAWGTREKGKLARMLQACPAPVDQIRVMLGNYARSIADGEYEASDAPRFWLEKLPRFAPGPRNRFLDPPKRARHSAATVGMHDGPQTPVSREQIAARAADVARKCPASGLSRASRELLEAKRIWEQERSVITVAGAATT